MRTTLRIDDDLLRRAKAAAAVRGTTLTALVEDALRVALAQRPPTMRRRVELPTSSVGSRLAPGVDLDDSAALLELMERDDPPV
jgi:hypothetical protein